MVGTQQTAKYLRARNEYWAARDAVTKAEAAMQAARRGRMDVYARRRVEYMAAVNAAEAARRAYDAAAAAAGVEAQW